MTADLAALRAFALAVLQHWPESSPDAFEIQDEAVKHGLLVAKHPKPTGPCSAEEGGCWCASYFSSEEFAAGVTCYVRSPVLTGTGAGQSMEGELK